MTGQMPNKGTVTQLWLVVQVIYLVRLDGKGMLFYRTQQHWFLIMAAKFMHDEMVNT